MNVRVIFMLKEIHVFSLLSLLTSVCLAANTITTNGSLSGHKTLISPGGTFELGFFKPGNSSNYYIGIWYNKIPGNAVIWVANRDKPISNIHSTMLRVSKDGNLVLVKKDSIFPIWSTNLVSNISYLYLEATLLDDGNFVLRNGSSNSSSSIWQSFDYPTDTLLPGAKLGLNKKTKWGRVLTSWKNMENPSMGSYSIKRDPNASQFIMIWNKSRLYWRSGLWVPDQKIFSLIPELRFIKTQLYSFSYVDNDEESYITYSIKMPSIVTRLVMDVSGQLKQLTWLDNVGKWVLFWSQPGEQCEVLAYCGSFGSCNQYSLPFCHCLEGFEPTALSMWKLDDYSGGCARKSELKCKNGQGHQDKFLANPNMVLPEHRKSVAASSSRECEDACSKNCQCTAYAYDTNGCLIWFGNLLNMRELSDSDSSGVTLYTKLSEAALQRNSHKVLVIGILFGLFTGLVLLLAVAFFVHTKGKRRLRKAAEEMRLSLTRFEYRDLQSATKNFSDKLGGGGFGSVFKGTLPDSTVIAVKKLDSIGKSQGEKQFRAEVSAIGTIQHVNLVRLHGFCSEGDHKRLLVYEYMPHGSLETHLFKRSDHGDLPWKVRYQIAIGIARGLAYLHEKCRDCIIHCDIKPENILLDAEFNPKVADFGLAKLLGRDFSRVLTTIRGTRGYLAPEWISGIAITAKADVYSYGMMLFELISGRRNSQQSKEGKLDFFPTWAMTNIAKGENVLSILDPRLKGNAEKEQVMNMCNLSCWCVQDEESQRPSMGRVVQILEGFLEVDMPFLPRSLKMFSDEDDLSFLSPSRFPLSLESEGMSSYDSATCSVIQDNSTQS